MLKRNPARAPAILLALAMVLSIGASTVVAHGGSHGGQTITVCPDGSCDFTTIQDGVDAAQPGDTVLVKNGTYEESVLIETDDLILRGESESGVVIDVSGFDDRRGITARPADNDGFNQDKLDDLTIESLTVVGPSILDSSSSKHYGIHIFDAADLLVEDVTVRNSSRSELDLHAIDGGQIRDVRLDGEGTSGVGLGITDSHEILVEDARTEDNSWGGIAVFTSGSFAPPGSDNVTVRNHSSADETPPLYTQTHGHPITNLTLPQYDYVTEHPAFPSFTFFFQDLEPALDFAAGLDDAAGDDGATVQDRFEPTFHVGDGMSIQAAVHAAEDGERIVVHAGTYVEQVTVDKSVTIEGEPGATVEAPDSLDADADGNRNIVTVTGSGVEATLTGLTISGPGASSCGSLDSGVAVTHDARAVVSNNTIVSVRDDPLSGCQNGVGVTVGRVWHDTSSTSTAEASVVDNEIRDFQKSAVVVAGDGSSATIEDNRIRCSGRDADDTIAQDAIQLWQSASADVVGNQIEDCFQIVHGGHRGVGVHVSEGVHDTTIADNIIPGVQTGVAVMNYAPWTDPADHEPVRNLTVRDNRIAGAEGGIYLAGSADGVTVEGNAIRNASTLGVYVGPDGWLQDPPEFQDVAIQSNRIRDGDSPAVLVDDSAANVSVHLNRISGNDVGLLNDDDETVDARFNWWGHPTGPSNATLTPGFGDAVQGPVDVTPWCAVASCLANEAVHGLV